MKHEFKFDPESTDDDGRPLAYCSCGHWSRSDTNAASSYDKWREHVAIVQDWPWCEACRSYHWQGNPTCVLKKQAGAKATPDLMAAARAALDLLKTIQARDSEKDGDIMPMPWPEIDALELALGKTQAGSEAKPRVLITVEGGVIQDVTADTDCAVAIIDWDNVHAEDTYRPELFAFDKPDTVVSPADLAELHRVALEEIQQHIPRATA